MKSNHNNEGQSLVEFALALPILLLLVLGVFDLSRLFTAKIVLNNAAREGAYYLSRHPSDQDYDSDLGVYTYFNTVQAVLIEANNAGITLTDSNVVVTDSTCCTYGQPVEVTVNYGVELILVDIVTGPVNLSSTVRMLVQ